MKRCSHDEPSEIDVFYLPAGESGVAVLEESAPRVISPNRAVASRLTWHALDFDRREEECAVMFDRAAQTPAEAVLNLERFGRAALVVEEGIRIQVTVAMILEHTAVELVRTRWRDKFDLRRPRTRIRIDRPYRDG